MPHSGIDNSPKYQAEVQRIVTIHNVDNLPVSETTGVLPASGFSDPIMRLPTELICLIFKVARQDISIKNKKALKELPTEVVLSHVSRNWRSWALSTPSLWADFSYRQGDCSFLAVFDRLTTYLERSKTHWLYLSFTFHVSPGNNRSDTDANDLLTKIIPHAVRWRRLSIISDKRPVEHIKHLFRSISAPNLHYLNIQIKRESTSMAQSSLRAVLEAKILRGGAPPLRVLHLAGLNLYSWLPPLSNITTLILENPAYTLEMPEKMPWSSFIFLLKSSLENLSIAGCGNIPPPSFDIAKPIPMPHLKQLRFSNHNSLFNLLWLIAAPLLDSLTVQNINASEPHFPNDFPSLRTLNIVNCGFKHHYFASLRELTWSTKHLTISMDNRRGQDFIDAYSGEITWPELEVLNLNLQRTPKAANYLPFIKACLRRPGFTIRMHQPVQDVLTEHYPEVVSAFLMEGIIQTLNPCSLNGGGYWPAGGKVAENFICDDDVFYIPSHERTPP
ncbi:hypothetical protein GALMADRAFT_216141 [Galerina marginata CBS 339.88]|uniref:Uncharacterized protein n=1 Tax=Galerina marginata (strain CBS 339.88) TaxID=685588 RepID=A0A067SAZ0_GALM3|nr:hypothetical protein GALMADRAFT_216141 [Galerina marginata CBS 339.88]